MDATDLVQQKIAAGYRLGLAGAFPAVAINPPFGRKELGRTKLAGSDIESDQLEHKIAADSLLAMRDNGRAVIITGGGFYHDPLTWNEQKPSWQDRNFLTYLTQRHNVTHVIEVTKKAAARGYSKQGAAWPIRIITIEGRRPRVEENRTWPLPTAIEYAESFDDIRRLLNDEPVDIGRPGFLPRSEDTRL